MGDRYGPPSQLGHKRLRQILVEDAVQGIATPLNWAVGAYIQIAKETHGDVDRAFRDVLSEVHDLTGRAEMPIG